MLKNILKLNGASQMTKNEQQTTMAGKAPTCCLVWDPIARFCSKWDYACLGN